MDFDEYEFCVQVWFEDGLWNYSIVQEFDEEDVEMLAYGSADTRDEAVALVAGELTQVKF